jgi:hypothetical protein
MTAKVPLQTDTRIGSIEVKIKKLDAELGAFKSQMAKLREGPGKVSCPTFHLCAWPLFSLSIVWSDCGSHSFLESQLISWGTGCYPTTSSADVEAEEDVRRSTHAASTADLEYGASGYDY